MSRQVHSAPKGLRLGIRLSQRQHDLLQDASRAKGTTVSDFVLQHATRAAEQVLADRRLFRLFPQNWEAFVDALDRPERELPRLRVLMQEPTVLDTA